MGRGRSEREGLALADSPAAAGEQEVVESLVRLQGVTRKFGRFTAVQRLDLEVQPGEAVGLVGPNGAGKTTTLRLIAGLLAPTRGEIQVFGYPMPLSRRMAARRIGYLPERAALYRELRVREYLEFRCSLWGLDRHRAADRLERVVRACGLERCVDRVIGRLSKGLYQRAVLAGTLVHDPELLILDEPTIGLDPNQVREVHSMLRRLLPRRTLILSTHLLAEVERVCDRVLVLDHGRVVETVEPRVAGGWKLWVEVECDSTLAERLLRTLVEVRRFDFEAAPEGFARAVLEPADPTADLRALVGRLFTRNGILVRELSGAQRHLEDVFQRLTRPAGDLEDEAVEEVEL